MKRFIVALALLTGSGAEAQETEIAAAAAAAREHPRDVAVVRAHARALLRAGRFTEAMRVFHRVSQLTNSDAAALYEEASVGFAQNDFNVARNACRALAGRHRETVYYKVCLARSFLTLNRSERAFEALAEAEAIDPNNFELRVAIAEANRIRMNFAPAEEAYLAAIRIDGTSAVPHLGLGRLYAAANRHDDAVRELRAAEALDSTWPELLYELGHVVGGAEGLALLRRAAAGYPTYAPGLANLGDLELTFGTAEAARAAFARAVEIDEHLAPAHVGLGRALVALGRDDEAELQLQHALTLLPNSTAAWMALGEVHARTERYEEAFEDYRRAADGSPGDPRPLLTAARLAMQFGRETVAQAFLDRLLAMNDHNAEAYVLYGDVMRSQRDFAAAERAYQQALALPDVADRAAVEAALAEVRARLGARR